MPVQLTPYLSFRDEARQALDFYHSIFGGELTLSTFGEFIIAEHQRWGRLIADAGIRLEPGE